MDKLIPFNYEDKQVRVTEKNGEPWFVAKDVCEILEIEKHRDAISRLNGLQRGSVLVDTLGGKQEMAAINEAGLYKLIFTSRKPEAEKFTNWVASEVIPSIRKTGVYVSPKVDSKMLYQIAQALEEKERQVNQLQSENKLLAQDNLTWADRRIIDAVIKKYGAVVGFKEAWQEFKKELLYKHSINLNSRITNYMNTSGKKTAPRTLDMIDDCELQSCISTAVAICRKNRIDISDIINKFDKSA